MKVTKIYFDLVDIERSVQDVKNGFIEYSHQFGYEGDSIYDHKQYSDLVRRELFEKFLLDLGFCTYYNQFKRKSKYNPGCIEYYTRDLKKISLFRLKYSL